MKILTLTKNTIEDNTKIMKPEKDWPPAENEKMHLEILVLLMKL